jgi:hypothetical protein
MGLRENNSHSAGLKKKIRRLGAFKVGTWGFESLKMVISASNLGFFKK